MGASLGAKALAEQDLALDLFFEINCVVSFNYTTTSHSFPPSHPFLLAVYCFVNATAFITFVMPPRLRSAKFSTSTASSQFSCCTSTRPQCISQPARASREFSQTSCQQITLRRRKFYEWMNGPGRQLKEPLPGSTNYLGAYDKYGSLVRAGPGWQRDNHKKQTADAAPAMKAEEVHKQSGEKAPEGQEDLEELEQAIREGSAEEKDTNPAPRSKSKEEDDGKLPPETAEDLRPFPLNQYFRSQAVLSEDLREAIYQRVKKGGATVSLASVEFGVSNERVGAVVRLKQLEKEWIAQVCHHPLLFPSTT